MRNIRWKRQRASADRDAGAVVLASLLVLAGLPLQVNGQLELAPYSYEPPEYIYFPPNPPPIGVELGTAIVASSRYAPDTLRRYICEPFYPQYSARLVPLPGENPDPKPFTREQEALLEEFDRSREALLDELLPVVDRVMTMSPGARLAEFEGFAREQTPRIARLEQVADELRASLGRRDAWSEHREWRLNSGSLRLPREQTLDFEYDVLRAAGYYEPDFTPAQRRLLREAAIDLGELRRLHPGDPELGSLYLSFQPETARVRLPENPPDEVARLIGQFQELKSALKSELRDNVYELDRAIFRFTKSSSRRELADGQHARIAELEVLAEKLRQRLVTLPVYHRESAPGAIPEELTEKMNTYERDKRRLLDELHAFVRTESLADVQTDVTKASAQAQPGATGPDGEVRRANAKAQFEKIHRDRIRANDRLALEIQDSLVALLPQDEFFGIGGRANQFVEIYMRRRAERLAYFEYDVAALEPGLSPEQRRLLFSHALEILQLPLPGPQPQPQRAPRTVLRSGI